MADFQFNIVSNNISRRINQLRRVTTPEALNRIMLRITAKVGVKAEQLVGGYPPSRPPVQPKPRYSKRTGRRLKDRVNKEYVRTGTLGASLTSRAKEVSLTAWMAVIGSSISYSPYVWGMPDEEPGQAWFHQGVWTPIEEAITRDAHAYHDLVKQELQAELRKALT